MKLTLVMLAHSEYILDRELFRRIYLFPDHLTLKVAVKIAS